MNKNDMIGLGMFSIAIIAMMILAALGYYSEAIGFLNTALIGLVFGRVLGQHRNYREERNSDSNRDLVAPERQSTFIRPRQKKEEQNSPIFAENIPFENKVITKQQEEVNQELIDDTLNELKETAKKDKVNEPEDQTEPEEEIDEDIKLAMEIEELEKKQQEQPELEFYDLKTKQRFKTTDYKIVETKGRKLARTKAPSGVKSTRFVK